MRELRNGTKIIGLDHGYGAIKTANTVLATGITAYKTEPTFQGSILQFGDMFYRMGEGHKGYLADKWQDEDFYLLGLAGAAQELRYNHIYEADVHIAAGLPLTWVKTQREDFRRYITQRELTEFTYCGKPYKLHIVGCSVYPQGYAAVVDRLHEMNGVNMIADIGNGTMNVMYINNKKPVESQCFTEKVGVNKCLVAARNAVMDRLCMTIPDEIIEQVLRTGTAEISASVLECITSAVKGYCSDILALLRQYEYNPDLMRLYVVGGGSHILKRFGELDEDRTLFVPDVCAAAKGYEMIAYRQLKRRNALEQYQMHQPPSESGQAPRPSGVGVSAGHGQGAIPVIQQCRCSCGE